MFQSPVVLLAQASAAAVALVVNVRVPTGVKSQELGYRSIVMWEKPVWTGGIFAAGLWFFYLTGSGMYVLCTIVRCR